MDGFDDAVITQSLSEQHIIGSPGHLLYITMICSNTEVVVLLQDMCTTRRRHGYAKRCEIRVEAPAAALVQLPLLRHDGPSMH